MRTSSTSSTASRSTTRTAGSRTATSPEVRPGSTRRTSTPVSARRPPRTGLVARAPVALLQLPVVDGRAGARRPAVLPRAPGRRRAVPADPALGRRRDAAPRVLLDPAAGAADAAIAIDWFEASRRRRAGRRRHERRWDRGLGAARPRRRRRPRPRRGHPRHPGLQRRLGPRRPGFSYTRYPDGDQYHRTVHHHRSATTGTTTRRVGRAPRSAGVARRRAVAGRALAARPRARRLGAGTTSTSSTAGPAPGRTVDRRRRGHVDVPLRRRRRRRWSASRRSTHRTGGSCGAARRHRPADVGDARRRGRCRARRSSTSRATRCGSLPRSGPSTPSRRYAPDGTPARHRRRPGDAHRRHRPGCRPDTGRGVRSSSTPSSAPTTVWNAVGGGSGRAVVPGRRRRRRSCPSMLVVAGRVPVARRHGDRHVPDPSRRRRAGADDAVPSSTATAASPSPRHRSGRRRSPPGARPAGVYAIAGLRGGLEHGEDWHHAGRRGAKQNVFDDFHAAADWLVDDRLASTAIASPSSGAPTAGCSSAPR